MAVNLVEERRWICLSTRQSCYPPPAPISDAMVECPPFGTSPDMWTREEVRYWLEGCVREYGLNLDLPDRFPMNGKGLRMLSKEDFRQRAPDAGDVLYNSFYSFYGGGPFTLPYDRRSPDALTLKRKAMNLEREGRWFDSSSHRSDCESPEADYEQMVDSSEPLNLKVTRSRQPSPPSSPSPPSPPVSRTSTFDLCKTQPLLLFRSPTFDAVLNRHLPLPGSSPFDSVLNRPSPLQGLSTFDPESLRPRDRVGIPFSAGGIAPSQLRLHTQSIHPSYLPLFRPLPYVDLKRSIPTPSSSPPSSLLSWSSLSPPSSSSSSLFPSTHSAPTPSSSPTTSPQHTTELPCYHSSLPPTTSYLSLTSPTPPPTAPSAMHGFCTPSPASGPASGLSQASASANSFRASPTSEATVRKEETGIDQSQTTKDEVTPNWSQLMQVTTTSQTPETNSSKIHLNLSTSDRLLWKFLAELLNCKTAKCVSWEDRQRLTFQIVDPDELAELWGVEKCKPGMTYEKLSRALRYYYKMNIIAKVPGKRLTYRFITSPQFIKKGKRGAKPGVPHKRRNGGAPLSKTVANENQTKINQQQQ